MNDQQFEQAVARMVQGDKTGLKEIYEAYIGYIYRIVYEVLQNRENAEDVTSDFLSGSGTRQISLSPAEVTKGISPPWREIWPSTIFENTGEKS